MTTRAGWTSARTAAGSSLAPEAVGDRGLARARRRADEPHPVRDASRSARSASAGATIAPRGTRTTIAGADRSARLPRLAVAPRAPCAPVARRNRARIQNDRRVVDQQREARSSGAASGGRAAAASAASAATSSCGAPSGRCAREIEARSSAALTRGAIARCGSRSGSAPPRRRESAKGRSRECADSIRAVRSGRRRWSALASVGSSEATVRDGGAHRGHARAGGSSV
jgi:hypothetical protein